MKFSFIVTSYNVAPYIRQCLDSLLPCLRAGDEVILIDDGSSDQTDVIAEAAFAVGFGADVGMQLILLGANTIGGVGIPANIGLSHATGDAVFFVDGDDWLEAAGFLACRTAFETLRPDILIGNYLEVDDQTGKATPPADANRWPEVAQAMGDSQATTRLALSMIAVPWRKFYRRDFLQRANLRFPEGAFFYEDNPFHWQVCRAATQVQFHDRVLCRHRVNRPGQTMTATGTEFTAFFDHYDTICANLTPGEAALRPAALEWLVNNMSWHIGRMNPGAFWAYATRATQVLEAEAANWAVIRARYAGSAIGGMVEALVRGQTAATVATWMAERSLKLQHEADQRHRSALSALSAVRKDLTRLVAHSDAQTPVIKKLSERAHALNLIAEYKALRALLDVPGPRVADIATPDTPET